MPKREINKKRNSSLFDTTGAVSSSSSQETKKYILLGSIVAVICLVIVALFILKDKTKFDGVALAGQAVEITAESANILKQGIDDLIVNVNEVNQENQQLWSNLKVTQDSLQSCQAETNAQSSKISQQEEDISKLREDLLKAENELNRIRSIVG